ncbi:MAG: hypothetical protein MI700_04640 [Balneolales bacterium]|nr:hypothetical protein [Balneolales bacterium]
MNTFIIKSRPEQRGQLSFLIRIVSLIPEVKNWYIERNAGTDLLKVEATEKIDQSQLHSLLSLYEISMEVQS